MKPAIRVCNLSKCYRIGSRQDGEYQTLREALVRAAAAPWRRLAARRAALPSAVSDTHWVLNDLSFDVRPGEVVGILGRNGVGKSTLLKILCRITEPTSGRAEVRGRMGSLLEAGVGFHSELTGRENIYLNGAVLGMTRREINRKFDEIVAFSEIGPFLDTPAKRYSSGMYMRLAFAVAAHLEPEILVVDEVLAVGDAAFQKKCLGKMREVGRTGRTILFVSHNMAAVTNLCSRAILLTGGRIVADGAPQEVAQRYLAAQAEADRADYDLSRAPGRRPGREPVLRRLRLTDRNGQPTSRFPGGGEVRLELTLDLPRPLQAPQARVDLDNGWGQRVCAVATYLSPTPLPPLEGRCRVCCRIPELPLVPGTYTLGLSAGTLHQQPLDQVEQAAALEVLPHDFFGNGRMPTQGLGQVLVRSEWSADLGQHEGDHGDQ
jgi:lipopolysaccharide transport system ATP-binding protein